MNARKSCLTISAIKYPFLIHIFVQSERHPFVQCFVITLMRYSSELFSFMLHRFLRIFVRIFSLKLNTHLNEYTFPGNASTV